MTNDDNNNDNDRSYPEKQLPFSLFQVKITNNVPIVEEAKKGYYLFVSRETCVSRDEPFIRWILDYGCTSFIDFPNKKIYDYYLESKSYSAATKKLAEYLVSNWDDHIGTYPQRKKKLLQAAKRLAARVETESKKKIPDKGKILQDYLKTVDLLYDWGEYIFGAWAVIYFHEKEVIGQFPDYVDIIMSLDKPIDYIKMQNDMFRLKPQDMIKKYGWQKMYSSYDQPYTKEDFLNLKKGLKKNELDIQFRQFIVNRKKFSLFMGKIKDKELRIKVEAVHTYAFLKTDRIDTWKKAQWYLRSLHQYIADQIQGCSLRNASDFTIQETIDFLRNGIVPPLENLQLRSQTKALYYWHGNSVDVITDEKLIEETKKILEGNTSAVQELKGFTACPGKAKGVVKIINHSEDLKKINEGDIFVAKYTFPTYTPFMIKSAAIITDEGGITTHAAIISREYKKPCVIGVKKATSILKDGDVVEVDAEKGVIRILK